MGKSEDWKQRNKRNFEKEKWLFLVSETAKMRKEEENGPSVFPFISIREKLPWPLD